MRRVVPTVVWLLAGCSASDLVAIAPDLPNDAAYLAALLEREDGQFLGGSGLFAVGAARPVHLEIDAGPDAPRPARMRLFAFSREQIRGLSPPGDDILAQSPVARAGAHDPRLPLPPLWSGSGAREGDRFDLVEDGASIELTARWLPPCPAPLPPGDQLAVSLSCAVLSCEAEIVTDGCGLDVTFPSCQLGRLRGTVDGRGQGVFENDPLLGRCVPTATINGGLFAESCDRAPDPECHVEVYLAADSLPLQVATATIVVADPLIASVGLRRPADGYLGSVVPLEDRVVVAAFGGPAVSRSCANASGALVMLDRETLRPVATATTPRCTAQLVAAPADGGVIALSGGDESARLLRFDRDLRPRGEVAVAALPVPHRAIAFLSFPSSRRLVLVALIGEGYDQTWMIALDEATLLPVREPILLPGAVFSATALPADLVLLANETRDELISVDPTSGARAQVSVRNALASNRWIGRVAYHEASQRFVLTTGGRDSTTLVLNPRGILAQASYYRDRVEGYALATWPADPRLLVMGLTQYHDEHRAFVALFNPGGERPIFQPRIAWIGRGIVGELVPDGAGGVYATLPNTGHLVRLRWRE
ncbi:MAG: hypothetical protein IT384_09720 [Deltaproteobacteria bacterium]|nr:hypothetical protein [Deltaproteobacteria bacterium]